MEYTKHDEKLRRLVAMLNKKRKLQGRQIDILCNDLVAHNREFIKSLHIIGFAADFYEAIAGITDPNDLLYTASRNIARRIPNANLAFFLNQPKSFELHIFESDHHAGLDDRRIENAFTAEVVKNITAENKVCPIEKMLELGLQITPTLLGNISAVTIPLTSNHRSLGFILIYRDAANPLQSDDIKAVAGISPGLTRAIHTALTLDPAPA